DSAELARLVEGVHPLPRDLQGLADVERLQQQRLRYLGFVSRHVRLVETIPIMSSGPRENKSVGRHDKVMTQGLQRAKRWDYPLSSGLGRLRVRPAIQS